MTAHGWSAKSYGLPSRWCTSLTLSETWHDFENSLELNSTFNLPSYKLISQTRGTGRKGGGLGLYVSKKHDFKILLQWQKKSLQLKTRLQYTDSKIRDAINAVEKELLSKFDPVMEKHLNRAVENPNRTHYLGKNVQEELIQLISKATKEKILSMIKKAKYFSIIVDCTPGNSHKEQMSIIIHYVNIAKQLDNQVISVTIQESFIGFINVLDTTGLGLTEEILNSLESNNLSWIFRRITDINSQAFYIPCVCNSLNLVVADAVQGCFEIRKVFSQIQAIFNFFSATTKRWQNFESKCCKLTVKLLSTTRWESHVNAVRALKLGLKEIFCALKEVVNIEKVSITRLTAESLASKLDYVKTAANAFKKTIDFFVTKHTEDSYKIYISKAKILAINANLTDEFSSISRKRARKRKIFFDGEPIEEDGNIQPNQKFKKQFFNVLFKIAKESINERFESFSRTIELFESLYGIKDIDKIGEEDIINKCRLLEKVLTHGESNDVHSEICFWN
ncbi:uncharacterized protein LOC136086125 [Hydra vulgaris]|uniref:Uncharacterized protein LOC136086125 n=1 Tax=Hydra vulgaris TaxID=6087 RepID=A0ABM4CRG8_HYDVU